MINLKKWFVRSVKIFIVLLFLYNAYNFICFKLLKYDIVPINGYAVLEVVSGSMEPTIKVGDLIVVDINSKKYRKDDIVTFRDGNGSFITHRIISINEKEIKTKGDNNEVDDGFTSVKNIVGKYKFKISGGGRVLSYLRNPFVMIVTFILGGLICIMVSVSKTFVTGNRDLEYQNYLKNVKSSTINNDIVDIERLDVSNIITKKKRKKSNKKKKKKRAKRKRAK